MGMLNFSSKFVTDYKRIATPLNALMSVKAGGRWREQHTEALNLIATLVWQRLKLTLVDMKKELELHVDTDDDHLSVVLTQGDDVCTISGRPLSITEKALPVIERLLIAAVWGYKRYAKYCLYVP
jgi:hypothetical protein